MRLNITESEIYYTNELDAIQDTIKKNFPNFDVHIARGKYPFISVRVTKNANKNIQHRLLDLFTIRQEADGRITCTCPTYDDAEFFDLIGIVNYFDDYLNNPNTENNRGYFESVKRQESFRRKRTYSARMKENYYTTDNLIGHGGMDDLIHNFRFSGDWFEDYHDLEDELTDYYRNDVGVYNDNIRNRISDEVLTAVIQEYPESEEEIRDEFAW